MPDLILLTAAGSLLRVESSPEVMDEIRARALAGYRALRKTGVGVGGLLLGERDGGGVRVLESVELQCSHAFGPGFVLTPEEKAQGRELVSNAGAMEVVGWYFSRTRGEPELTEQERALCAELFPSQTHERNLTLILMPAPDALVGSELFIVDAQGLMLKAMEREAGVVTAAPAAVAPLPPEQPVCVPLMPLLQEPPLPAFLRSVQREDGERLESGNVKRWTRIAIAVVLMVVGLAVFEAQSLWLNEAVPVNKSAGSGQQTVPAGR